MHSKYQKSQKISYREYLVSYVSSKDAKERAIKYNEPYVGPETGVFRYFVTGYEPMFNLKGNHLARIEKILNWKKGSIFNGLLKYAKNHEKDRLY